MTADDHSTSRQPPVVAIGASAGGLKALTEFFEAMPPDSGLAFVVVQHLDPSAESRSAEILSRHTEMAVVKVHQAVEVEPNHVYFIMPRNTLHIDGRCLRITERTERAGKHRPVDVFFRSLGENCGESCACIILSGAGSNGSLGAKTVKERGGLVMAQEPATAEVDAMPREAIRTGCVDLVLPPAEMPTALLRFADRVLRGSTADAARVEDAEHALQSLLASLRNATGIDFRSYKSSTVRRRVQRRMVLTGHDRLTDYAAMLRDHPGEAKILVDDLLITVTSFFRDPEAWQTLRSTVLEPLIAHGDGDRTIRAWVPGCATGEEAYSLAILLNEVAEAAGKHITPEIFATDISERALARARAGVYPAAALSDEPQSRIVRCFERVDDSVVVKADIRESVVFASQNLLYDPPFSHLDILICRNLLIYLDQAAQKRAIALFHFALDEGGHLFLGSAESVGDSAELFADVSKPHRIYRRVGPTRHDIVSFPVPRGQRPYQGAKNETITPDPYAHTHPSEIILRALAERYAPAAVLTDRNLNVLYYHGPTDRVLTRPSGEPSNDLLQIAPEGLRARIRHLAERAAESSEVCTVRGRITREGRSEPLVVTAASLTTRDERQIFLFTFAREGEDRAAGASDAAAVPEPSSYEQELEGEIRLLRDELRSTVRRAKQGEEDLRASNEEITSMNEELRSTNEELETSKEELQSLNEELSTVNAQLRSKVEELQHRTSDLNNLLNSTNVATLFLDADLRIRWFTPEIKRLTGLVDRDIGRPLADFSQKVTGDDLFARMDAVRRTLEPQDAEVEDADGCVYLSRISPYTGNGARAGGLVLSFLDITERHRAEEETRRQKAYAEAILEAVQVPLIALDPECRVVTANRAFRAEFRLSDAEIGGRRIYDLSGGAWDIARLRRLLEVELSQRESCDGYEIEAEFPEIGSRVLLLNARRIERLQLLLLSFENITERRAAERHQRMMMGELDHRVKNNLAVVSSIAAQTARRSQSLEEFLPALQGRLHALAQTHTTLAEQSWRSAGLRTLVERVTAAQGADERIHLRGEAVALTAQQTLAMGMILHELATNAVKYGALSVPDGRVDICWEHDEGGEEGATRLVWQEIDGPPVKAPAAAGYGMKFVTEISAYELAGETRFEFRPEGLHCELVFVAGGNA